MVFVENFLATLKRNKINFFTGVPDSVLKNLSVSLEVNNNSEHQIAVNEGSAIGIGIGHYLATKKLPCVYMQNSGLGNAINPIISIADKKIYSIPMLLLIGWRGAPNSKDEPQHMVKGKITPNLLKLLNIDFCKVKKTEDLKKLDILIKKATKEKKIVACLIENKILKNKKKLSLKQKKIKKFSASREIFLNKLLKLIKKDVKIISTTGHTSRELMKVREEKKLKKGKDFYMVGGMGHSLSVAIGMSIKLKKQIICVDGDGSLLMHLGPMFTNSLIKKGNLKHILLNNNSHESVGGQETGASKINFELLSRSLGYDNYYSITKNKEIEKVLKKFLKNKKTSLLEVYTKSEIGKKLPRPKNLIKIKHNFIK